MVAAAGGMGKAAGGESEREKTNAMGVRIGMGRWGLGSGVWGLRAVAICP